MHKKLTITIDDQVYDGLHRTIGRGRISQFIEGLVRPFVVPEGLHAAYALMAADKAREAQALEWSEAFFEDASNEQA